MPLVLPAPPQPPNRSFSATENPPQPHHQGRSYPAHDPSAIYLPLYVLCVLILCLLSPALLHPPRRRPRPGDRGERRSDPRYPPPGRFFPPGEIRLAVRAGHCWRGTKRSDNYSRAPPTPAPCPQYQTSSRCPPAKGRKGRKTAAPLKELPVGTVQRLSPPAPLNPQGEVNPGQAHSAFPPPLSRAL